MHTINQRSIPSWDRIDYPWDNHKCDHLRQIQINPQVLSHIVGQILVNLT